MNRLFLFYPQNDVALAANITNFTAPKAAVSLQSSGMVLPLWLCSEGDKVMCNGVNARWFDEMHRLFAFKGDVWNHSDFNLAPTPWGWSKSSRNVFINNGFRASSLPSDVQLEMWRSLSHRRTSRLLSEAIAPRLPFTLYPAATEVKDIEAVAEAVAEHGQVVAKSPWSSSGRGVFFLHSAADIKNLEGTIRRQGSVMLEPLIDKTMDFALLFEMNRGMATFRGYSEFYTTDGSYRGNKISSQQRLHDDITSMVNASELAILIENMCRGLEQIVGEAYDGPVGVDMLCDASGRMHIVEVNLRYTMGFVALALSAYVNGDAFFHICQRKDAPQFNFEVSDGRLDDGCVPLTPVEGDFVFYMEVNHNI